MAAAIILFLIRAIIALLPVLIFIFLPLALIVKLVVRRMRRKRLAREGENEIKATT